MSNPDTITPSELPSLPLNKHRKLPNTAAIYFVMRVSILCLALITLLTGCGSAPTATPAPIAAPTTTSSPPTATSAPPTTPATNSSTGDMATGIHVCAYSDYDATKIQCVHDTTTLAGSAKLDQTYLVWSGGDLMQVRQKDGTGAWQPIMSGSGAGFVSGNGVAQSPDNKRTSIDLANALNNAQANPTCPWTYQFAETHSGTDTLQSLVVSQSC
jgi:hypothetical protein